MDDALPLVEVLGDHPLSSDQLTKYWGGRQTTDAVYHAWKILSTTHASVKFMVDHRPLAVHGGREVFRFSTLSFEGAPVAGLAVRDGDLVGREWLNTHLSSITQYCAIISLDDAPHIVSFPASNIGQDNVSFSPTNTDVHLDIGGVDVSIRACEDEDEDDDGDSQMAEPSLFADGHFCGVQGMSVRFNGDNPASAALVYNIGGASASSFVKQPGPQIPEFRCVAHFGFKSARPVEVDELEAFTVDNIDPVTGQLLDTGPTSRTAEMQISHFLYGLSQEQLILVVAWTQFGTKPEIMAELGDIFALSDPQPKTMSLVSLVEWWLNSTVEHEIANVAPLAFTQIGCDFRSLGGVAVHPCFSFRGKGATTRTAVHVSSSRNTSGQPLSDVLADLVEHDDFKLDGVFDPESRLFTICPVQIAGPMQPHMISTRVRLLEEETQAHLFSLVHCKVMADFMAAATRNFLLMDIPFFEFEELPEYFMPDMKPLAMLLDEEDEDTPAT